MDNSKKIHTWLSHVRLLKTTDKEISKGSQKKNKTQFLQSSKVRKTFKYSAGNNKTNR